MAGLRGAALCLTLLAGLLSPARAEEPLALEGRIGLGGRAVCGPHVACVVRARLGADQPAWRGVLRVGIDGVQLGGSELPLELTPGVERRIRLTVPFLRSSVYRARLVEDGGARRNLEVELGDDTKLVDERSVALFGAVGWSALGGGEDVVLVHLAPDEFPLEARPLHGLGCLVVPLREDLRARLEDEAFASVLRDYVSRGGTVLFTAQPDAPRVGAGGPLEPLLPLREPRPRSLTAAELAGTFGELSEASLPGVTGELAPGARWVERSPQGGLLAELPLGSGRVRYLVCDPDARGLRHAPRLGTALRRFAKAGPRLGTPSHLTYDLAGLAQDAFAARAPLGPLGFSLLVLVVVLHGSIAVALALVLRRRRREPWLALLVPPLLSALLGVAVVLTSSATQAGASGRALVLIAQRAPDAAAAAPSRVVLGLDTERPARLGLELGSWDPEPDERGLHEAFLFRETPPWVHEGGAGRTLEPLGLPGHGHSRWSFLGERAGLPLTVELSQGVYRVGASVPIEGLIGVVVAPKGLVAFTQLEPVEPGRSVRFDPADARSLPADIELRSDPFAEDAELERFTWRAIQGLGWQRGQSGPVCYLLHVAREALGSPRVLERDPADPREVPVQALVLTLVPLEAP